MSVKISGEAVVARKLYNIRRRVDGPSIALMRVMQIAAVLLESQTKINIRRNKMSSSGALMDSIRGEASVAGKSILVQVYSTLVYSKIHEEGKDKFTPDMQRAMFWRLRAEGRLKKGYTSKGIAPNDAGGFQARPYFQPAYAMHKRRIGEMVRKAILEEK
jgi:hypothetical protein